MEKDWRDYSWITNANLNSPSPIISSYVQQEEKHPLIVLVSKNTKMAENKMVGVHATWKHLTSFAELSE